MGRLLGAGLTEAQLRPLGPDELTADVVVIGAGIVGLSAALTLQQRGHRVLLLDRDGVAAQASRGNAGAYAFSDVLPMASPGILRQVPRWLLDPLGPLALRPGYLLPLLPWLWRFHRVHHTDRSPDATTSLRTHPVALVCLSLFMEGGSILIGTPLSVLLLYSGIAAAVSHWQHANVELHSPRTERVLSLLVNPPRVHRRHHSREPGDAHSNFSDVLSIWDRLFGTYRGPSSAPVQFGVSGHDDPPAQTLLGMLRSPLSRSP